MFLTICTPTYNRSTFLYNIFECLCLQESSDFEWLIVDDGSNDDTTKVIETFKQKSFFPIRYFKKTNGGKHTAINKGVQEANGEIFLILDSDDALPKDSVSTILHYYQQISKDPTFGGVIGYMAHRDGALIGRGEVVDGIIDTNTIDLRFKYNIIGDMCEVFRTNVLKEFPFPEIDKERFCPEALVWNRIAKKYKFRVFHKVIYFRDYLDGGLTDNIIKIRMKSPIASMMCYTELTTAPIPFLSKIKAAINYWRFRCCKTHHLIPSIGWEYYFLVPLGWLMHLNDLRITKIKS